MVAAHQGLETHLPIVRSTANIEVIHYIRPADDFIVGQENVAIEETEAADVDGRAESIIAADDRTPITVLHARFVDGVGRKGMRPGGQARLLVDTGHVSARETDLSTDILIGFVVLGEVVANIDLVGG